ncbi:hypothetical protein, partial [Vibrio cholerae]|uniref:hypothetical protein n=1 Tax=Vibrio cholerae TaxID=666 RepID=UPI00301CF9E5
PRTNPALTPGTNKEEKVTEEGGGKTIKGFELADLLNIRCKNKINENTMATIIKILIPDSTRS